jgi:peptidoglycan/LPS O-acetylase OafA/YrhL
MTPMNTQTGKSHDQAIGTHSRTFGTYLPTLDGWRTIAIALVLFSHASDSLQIALHSTLFAHSDELKKIGLLGVQLFFGLSGFLITSKLIDEELRHGKISLYSFYIRRAFRILPASVFFLTVAGLLALGGIMEVSLGRWISTLLFSANYTSAEPSWYLGHFWSLAVEEHFYFLWPAAFLFLRVTSKRVALAIFLALFVAAWRAVDFKFQITGSSAAIFWGRTDIQADSILWGVLLALLYGDPVWRSRLQKFYSLSAAWPLLVAVLFGLEFIPKLNWKIEFSLLTVRSILIPMVLLGTVIHSSKLPGRILETSVFRWIGRLSYSLYLWQQLFLVWNENRVPYLSVWQSFPVNLLAVFVCATLSMLLIENPLIAIGHRIAKNIERH